MTVLIIASNKDPASINIKNCLLKQSQWENINTFYENKVYKNIKNQNLIIITINDRKILHDNIDTEVQKNLGLKPKLAIFISRHTSKTGNPTLTLHPIGNYGKALFGGRDKKLIQSSPIIMTELLRILKRNANEKNLYHNVCFEVTHHGPNISIPSLFIEVGSNPDEWKKISPANAVAKSILELFELSYIENRSTDIPVLIGLGGGHYAPRFTDIALERKVAFGHMIPTYQINSGVIDELMIEEVIKNTRNLSGVYIHRKALKKSQVTEFKKIFKNKGIRIISSNDLEKIY
ncbi:MAG: D-aminoacyl-tRNA deacylase [Thermoplasmatales archaeon]|nr:D-aminoacyl-tRNA deacylase [Thermoplasmatales archaeon]